MTDEENNNDGKANRQADEQRVAARNRWVTDEETMMTEKQTDRQVTDEQRVGAGKHQEDS